MRNRSVGTSSWNIYSPVISFYDFDDMGHWTREFRVRIWPVVLVVMFVVILFSTLSEKVTLGPNWTFKAVVIGVLVLFIVAKLIDHHVWIRRFSFFLTYIFFAFNTSTAFSPTDTLIMSKRMKILVMTQASVSLIIVAVLASRAIRGS
ncbi:hypothetical protein NZD89_26595 [Alicyclobacillus fastidiosus]|uniref:Uncharacterized protein n=1 Tax=Alicyclobacillus fastidiosus TaxID=392011 RepID=A0ABY6ZFU6_9BACL|nr:hypothetical protein [Alicyclobacillus fastidiosus]WAH41732.1 hypothetical protein NZD89_26595 [Alicyclobacillus fastidiosus]